MRSVPQTRRSATGPEVYSTNMADYPYAISFGLWAGVKVHANVGILRSMTLKQRTDLLSALQSAAEAVEDLLTPSPASVE